MEFYQVLSDTKKLNSEYISLTLANKGDKEGFFSERDGYAPAK